MILPSSPLSILVGVFGGAIAMAIGGSPKPDSIPSDSIELERSIEVFDLVDEGADVRRGEGHPLNSPIPDFKTPSRANLFSRTQRRPTIG